MKNETIENPFEDLNPVYRSEEDDIRKGIFSKALRALATSSLDERLKWCAAIRLTQQPAASASSGGSSKKKAQKEVAGEPPATSSTLKRSRSPEAPTGAPKEEGEEERKAASEAPFTLAEASEYIGAFMRTMLDRVVGLSLENLSVPQLKVLCMMVGIPETSSRNKSVVYSLLATFYFTHCEKLGKRVSKSTFIEQQAREDAAMLLRVKKDVKAGEAKNKGERKEPVPPKKAMEEKKEKVKRETRKPAEERPKAVAAKPQPTMAATLQHKGTFNSNFTTNIFGGGGNSNSNFGFESDEDEVVPEQEDATNEADAVEQEEEEEEEHATLHVMHNDSIFQKKSSTHPASGSNSAFALAGAVAEEDPWSPAMLEKRIASIVHLYDPVTTSIVVKKLAQAGYRNDAAQQIVERTLQKFHDRQFIFYDNGIAYLM